ncbi:MAG: protein TolR [Pseudomonadota bacterium]
MSLGIRRHRKRKLKSEINVVPYIDVMLVLLVIFMITAPLLNLGVDVTLPDGKAKSLQQKQDPIVVTAYADGRLALTRAGESRPTVMESGALTAQVAGIVRNAPETPVLVAGDARASYQQVWNAISTLKEAGVDKVSLMSVPGAAAQ